MKSNSFVIVFILSVLSVQSLVFCDSTNPVLSHDNGMKLYYQQLQLENEGRELEHAFGNEEAFQKYEMAFEIAKKHDVRFGGPPSASMVRVLQKQGKYHEAYLIMKSTSETYPKKDYFKDRAKELTALIEYQQTSDPQPVYAYISWYRETHRQYLPPAGYDVTEVETLIRLYDTLGDYDAGIRLVDECFEYFRKVDIKKYGEYKPGRVDEDFIKVRSAFEQDKRENPKGPAPKPRPLGRATKVLIQSDYFPW